MNPPNFTFAHFKYKIVISFARKKSQISSKSSQIRKKLPNLATLLVMVLLFRNDINSEVSIQPWWLSLYRRSSPQTCVICMCKL